MKLRTCKYEQSCDCCISQEGKHWCLLHTKAVKNMDTVRCKDWTDRETGKQPNAREA